MDYDFKDIIESINTNDDKRRLLQIVDTLSGKIFRGEEFEKELKDKTDNPEYSTLVASFEKNKIDVKNKDKAENFLSSLKKTLNELKSVNIILAIPANDRIISLLKTWAHENIGDRVIFDILVDERIIGGAIIIYAGQYIDMSLSSKMDEIFATKKGELFSSLGELKSSLNN